MWGFIWKRLRLIPVTLFILMFVSFLMLRVTGDPVEIYLGIEGTPEQAALLTEKLHLDDPLIVQFGYFILDVAQGDFGESLRFGGDVWPIIQERFGATAQLMGAGLLAAVGGGVLLGIVCALNKDKFLDFSISALAIAGQSMPSFWLGILLIQVFALKLGWLPTSGMGGPENLILPTLTLTIFLMPNFILLTRTSFLETMREQYAVTARAKGVSEIRLIFLHVLPNAISPVVTYLGLQMGRLVGGSVITETIFAWPGIGRLMISSIFQRDVPVVIATVFVVCLAITISNLLVDIVNSFIDPRIRLE